MQDFGLFITMKDSNGNLTFARTGKDLHLFVSDASHQNQSLELFHDLYFMRTTKSLEYWLLDVSMLEPGILDSSMQDLKTLDLNDDLYLYELKDNGIEIWEYYEIHSSLPRVLQAYGFWTEVDLEVFEMSKWIRRRDLKVHIYICSENI